MVVTFLLVLSETWCFNLLRRVKTCMKIWRCYPPSCIWKHLQRFPVQLFCSSYFSFWEFGLLSWICLAKFGYLHQETNTFILSSLRYFFSFWFRNRHRWLIWYDIPSLKHGWSKLPEWIHSSQWRQQWYHPAEFLKIGKKVHISGKTA